MLWTVYRLRVRVLEEPQAILEHHQAVLDRHQAEIGALNEQSGAAVRPRIQPMIAADLIACWVPVVQRRLPIIGQANWHAGL